MHRMRSKNTVLNGAKRCEGTTRNGENAGNQCMAAAALGSRFCMKHGAQLPTEKAKRELELRKREAARVALTPEAVEPARAHGDAALAEELRRTLAWIDYCEQQLKARGVAFEDADDDESDALASVLGGLGVVRRETIGASEWEGVNVYEQRGVNVWEEKLRWNRAHLAVLTKQWIAAGFEARRLEMQRATIERMEKLVSGIARDLGHNPTDPDVRKVILQRIRREIAGNESESETADSESVVEGEALYED